MWRQRKRESERKQEGRKRKLERRGGGGVGGERLRDGRPHPQNPLNAVAIHLSASSPSLLLLNRDGSTVKKIGRSLSGHSSGRTYN